MPIYPVNNSKMLVINEEKTRGITMEYPKDMGNGELLDRINEIRNSVIKSIEVDIEDAKNEPAVQSSSKIEPILNY